MKLFNVVESQGYETFGLLDEDWDIMEKFEGIERILDEWGERELRLHEENCVSDLAYFTDMPYSMLLNEKAFDSLSSIIDSSDIEMLPTKYKEKKYFLLHCIKAYDVKYELEKDVNENFKMVFDSKELLDKGLCEKGLFKVKYKGGTTSDILFTEMFVEAVNNFNLKGCEFRVEWESEDCK